MTSVAAVHARLSSLPICSLGASLGNAELLSFSTAANGVLQTSEVSSGHRTGQAAKHCFLCCCRVAHSSLAETRHAEAVLPFTAQSW